jgi:hypothetical protein
VSDETEITLTKTAGGPFHVITNGEPAPNVIDLWLSASAGSHPPAATAGLTRLRVEGEDRWKVEQYFEVTEITMTLKARRSRD